MNGQVPFKIHRLDSLTVTTTPNEPVVIERRDLERLIEAVASGIDLLESELIASEPIEGRATKRRRALIEGTQSRAIAEDVFEGLYPATRSSAWVRAPLGPCNDFVVAEEDDGECAACGWPGHDHEPDVVGVSADGTIVATEVGERGDGVTEHCWHMRSVGMLPGKKGHALTRERCCWCGVERGRTHKSVPDKTHGPHVKDPRKSKNLDVDEVPPCVERKRAKSESEAVS